MNNIKNGAGPENIFRRHLCDVQVGTCWHAEIIELLCVLHASRVVPGWQRIKLDLRSCLVFYF